MGQRRFINRLGAYLRTATVVAVATAMPLAASGLTGVANAAPPPPAGFTTIFVDDFNGPAGSAVDGTKWMHRIGTGYVGGAPNWGTGEIEYNTNSTANVYQDGAGRLAIKPIRDGAGNWTSGRLETQRTDLGAPAGGVMRVEAELKLPDVTTTNGMGYWPAFWMLGEAARPSASTNWPAIGEIDIMESANGRSNLFQTLHCGVSPGGPCNETNGIGTGERGCNGCQTGFHRFGTEVDRSISPEQIRFYLDGALSYTINSNQVDATTWANAVHHGYFLILNVAMGGGFPNAFGGGPFASTVSGVPMLVDSVIVSTKGPGAPAPVSNGSKIAGPGGKCVDVAGNDTGGNGAAVQLWDCIDAAVDQRWSWNGTELKSLGRCLDIANMGTANLSQLQLWDCVGNGAQQWQQQADGSLRNPASGRCVDSPAGSTANGARLQIYDCNGSAAQKFQAPASSSAATTIIGIGSKCVDVAGVDNGGNGTAIQLWDCEAGAVDQKWAWNGTTLRTLNRCLSIVGNATGNFAKAELYDCNGSGSQQWQQEANGALRNPASGRCLDSPAAATTNGTRLQIYDCNGSAAQVFRKS